ncbi:hypothetical protein QBC32DRAFT_382881 [Pseudoneurospora amorphoporcata]|uniref:Uncharacterized protein n=1 Tax=Pseudoneurospora amorphoporcata TaxID=241081 RepID=A0AAN6NLJ8_9PEZI|nr:hypothetical protein QBC32DRAFT_382881 [Pseudoneurospora amorphoporcata]
MAPRAVSLGAVGSAALAGTPLAAAPSLEQHQPGARAPGCAPARAGAAEQEDNDDDDTVEKMFADFWREIERPGTSRISGASSSSTAAHNNLPAAPPAPDPVPPITEDTDASAQQTQPNSSVSSEQSPRALPSLGRGRYTLTAFSSGAVASGSGLLAEVAATSAAAPSQDESGESSRFIDVGFDGSLLMGETLETGTARIVQCVRAPQVRVVHVPARRQQGQAEEGNEEGEELRNDDERGRELGGVAPGPTTMDSVDEEIEFDDDDEGMEDQAAEEAAAQAACDQRRNRRLGRAVFTAEEVRSFQRRGWAPTPEEVQSVQSFLPSPSSSSEDGEAPSDSSPPSHPAPSVTGATAPAAAPVVPSLGSPSASAGPQDFLAVPHPRVPPVSHTAGVDPYDTGGNTVPIMAVGEQALETVPYHPDTGHRAALSDDEEP